MCSLLVLTIMPRMLWVLMETQSSGLQNLDRLSTEGIRFERAYTNSPICTPSRQSLITGRYPHASGVSLLETPLSQDQVTIAEHLKNYGFATGAVGKMHFNSDLKHGF